MESKAFNIARLIAKYLRNELSPEEEATFQKWLQESDSNRQLLESFRKGEAVQEEIDYINRIDTDAAWRNIEKRRNAANYGRWLRYTGYAAAAMILLVSAGIWIHSYRNTAETKPVTALLYKNDIKPGSNKARLILSDGRQVTLSDHPRVLREQDGTEISGSEGQVSYNSHENKLNHLIFNTLVVPKAGTYRIVLPDGTKVWVNAMSELRFPVKFDKRERKVYLKGEAYFEVAKEAERPFRVEASHTTVDVLGTHFNINAYSEVTSTTLLSGSVKVHGYGREKLLAPGQQATISEGFATVEATNVSKAIAWKNGEFYFNGDRMTEIARQLSRWYDLQVEYKGVVPDKTYSGSIKRNVNLSEVLDMLQFVSNAQFEINGRQLIIIFK